MSSSECTEPYRDLGGDGERVRYRLGRKQRIRGRSEFARIFTRRCSVGDGRIALFVDNNDCAMARLGISVSRRLGNAVVRAGEKRRLREAFRQRQYDLPQLDMVFVVKRRGMSVEEYSWRLVKLAAEAWSKLRRGRRND